MSDQQLTAYEKLERGPYRFDRWRARAPIPSRLGELFLTLLTDIGERPDDVMLKMASKLDAFVRDRDAFILDIIHAHYRRAELEGWLEGVPRGLSKDEVLEHVDGIDLDVAHFGDHREAVIQANIVWDQEHKLRLRVDGGAIQVNEYEEYEWRMEFGVLALGGIETVGFRSPGPDDIARVRDAERRVRAGEGIPADRERDGPSRVADDLVHVAFYGVGTMGYLVSPDEVYGVSSAWRDLVAAVWAMRRGVHHGHVRITVTRAPDEALLRDLLFAAGYSHFEVNATMRGVPECLPLHVADLSGIHSCAAIRLLSLLPPDALEFSVERVSEHVNVPFRTVDRAHIELRREYRRALVAEDEKRAAALKKRLAVEFGDLDP